MNWVQILQTECVRYFTELFSFDQHPLKLNDFERTICNNFLASLNLSGNFTF